MLFVPSSIPSIIPEAEAETDAEAIEAFLASLPTVEEVKDTPFPLHLQSLQINHSQNWLVWQYGPYLHALVWQENLKHVIHNLNDVDEALEIYDVEWFRDWSESRAQNVPVCEAPDYNPDGTRNTDCVGFFNYNLYYADGLGHWWKIQENVEQGMSFETAFDKENKLAEFIVQRYEEHVEGFYKTNPFIPHICKSGSVLIDGVCIVSTTQFYTANARVVDQPWGNPITELEIDQEVYIEVDVANTDILSMNQQDMCCLRVTVAYVLTIQDADGVILMNEHVRDIVTGDVGIKEEVFEGGSSASLAIPWTPRSYGDYTLTLEIVEVAPETGQPLMDEKNLLSTPLILQINIPGSEEPLAEPEPLAGCGPGTVLVDGVCELVPTPKAKSSFMSIDPLYIIIGAVVVGGVAVGALFALKRGSGTPKPTREELEEYESKYVARKPAEKKETSMFCDNCGVAFKKSEAKFCGECGTPRS